MRNLLAANFARLRKDKSFWIILASLFLMALATIMSSAESVAEMEANGLFRSTEYFFFSSAPYLGIFYAVFIGLFLGADYVEGPLRNRLIAGYRRREIYLADWLSCYAACSLFFLAWYMGGLPGLWWIGPFESGLVGHLVYLLVGAGFTGAFCALFLLACCLTDHKALMVILPAVFWMCLTLMASGLYDRLLEPATLGGIAFINGEFRALEETPNPLYLSGTVRQIFEGLLDFLPTGQVIEMGEIPVEKGAPMLLSSGIFTALALFLGLAVFERKNLK